MSFVDPGDQGEFRESRALFLNIRPLISPLRRAVWILASSEESTSYFHCPLRIDIDETGSQPVEILDMNFFNKSEIVVVLVTSGSEGLFELTALPRSRWRLLIRPFSMTDSKMLLVTIEYTALAMTIVQLPGRPDISAIWDGCKVSSISPCLAETR